MCKVFLLTCARKPGHTDGALREPTTPEKLACFGMRPARQRDQSVIGADDDVVAARRKNSTGHGNLAIVRPLEDRSSDRIGNIPARDHAKLEILILEEVAECCLVCHELLSGGAEQQLVEPIALQDIGNLASIVRGSDHHHPA